MCRLAGITSSEDIFPMKYDMVIVKPDAEEVTVWNQMYG
jgi:hypothetical protein